MNKNKCVYICHNSLHAGVAAKGTMKVAAGVGALLGTVASAVADKVVAAPSVQQAIRKNPGKADAVAKVGRAGVQARFLQLASAHHISRSITSIVASMLCCRSKHQQHQHQVASSHPRLIRITLLTNCEKGVFKAAKAASRYCCSYCCLQAPFYYPAVT